MVFAKFYPWHGRSGQAAVRIRDIHYIQQALNIAIFTNLAMQGVKHAVWFNLVRVAAISGRLQFLQHPARISRGLSTKLALTRLTDASAVHPPIRTATRS